MKATAPPKSSYKAPSGKEVKVRTNSKHAEYIRNQPSSKLTPAARQQTVNYHITNYHYGHPSGWYYSQPTYYVGGGYSSAFWYMMLEWDAERRARWLYNNQNVIERDAYERGMRDAEVARHVAALKAKNVQPDPDYVDDEFKSDPSLMYDDHYVEAVYNPTVVEPQSSNGVGLGVFLTIFVVLFIGFVVWWALFGKRYKEY